MNKMYSNRCTRCGKERIVARTWKEKFDNSVIINTEMVCPDKDCQKKVESENKKQKDKNTAMRLDREERSLSRKVARDAERIQKKKKS